MSDEPTHILSDGGMEWCDSEGQLHRDGDKPALVYPDGEQYWYQHGQLHRDGDKPARLKPNGGKEWYKNGRLHRDGDKPEIVRPFGKLEWYADGELVKEARVAGEEVSGTRWYRQNGFYGLFDVNDYVPLTGFIYSEVHDRDEPVSLVCDEDSGYWGAVDRKGKQVVPCDFASVEEARQALEKVAKKPRPRTFPSNSSKGKGRQR